MVGDVSVGSVGSSCNPTHCIHPATPQTPPPTCDGLELQPAGVLSVLYTFLTPRTARARQAWSVAAITCSSADTEDNDV